MKPKKIIRTIYISIRSHKQSVIQSFLRRDFESEERNIVNYFRIQVKKCENRLLSKHY